MRGIPLLVQIFFLYFGIGKLLNLDRYPAGVIAIGIGYSAYIGETVRAGIQAVPRGQWEAARSLGLSTPRCLRHVILPQALRVVIPPVLNDFVACLKDSSLVSIIGLAGADARGPRVLLGDLRRLPDLDGGRRSSTWR